MPSNQVRTPRKEKSFFRQALLFVRTEGSSGIIDGGDLLTNYKTDVGISQTRNVTVMDMRIRCQINRKSTTDVNQIWDWSFGIAWVPSNVTATNNPDPSDLGSRETRWIHKWDQSVLNDSVAQDRPGDNRFGDPLYIARTKNMAKQPSAGHDLRLILVPTFAAATATQAADCGIIVEGMLALP